MTPTGRGRRQPAYRLIAEALRTAILSGRLPEGAVLNEGSLAGMFGASRSPVRQAFAALEQDGLVRRFEGRGVVVGAGGVSPVRIAITPDLLGLGADPAVAVRDDAWDRLYYALERELILASVYGSYRVNELALARAAHVGRTVARNLLLRAQRLGLLVKGDSAHWHLVPLSEKRLSDLYELRIQLEPVLIASAAGAVPRTVLDAIEARIRKAPTRFSLASEGYLDRMEEDIHVTCLSYGHNSEMFEALKRAHCTLIAGKHMQIAIPNGGGIDSFSEAHLGIVQAVKEGDAAMAATRMRRHLSDSQERAIVRLKLLQKEKSYDARDYLI